MGSAAELDLKPADPLRDRFLEALEAIWPEGADVGEGDAGGGAGRGVPLGISVSGGPDSTALLLLAAAALPGRVEAATVDHGLRAANAEEAAQVALLCRRLGVAHRTLSVDVAPGNVQDAARQARYAALRDWAQERDLGAVATAHHADDQAETLIMRLNRASGVAGLAGARPRATVPGSGIPLLRPLLSWRRAELAQVVADAGVPTADDPSNRDDRFDRARLRKALAGADWLDPAALAASARHIADADAALSWSAELEYKARVKREPFGVTYKPMAPRAIALRVVARIVAELTGEEPRGGTVARLFDSLVAGRPATIGELVVRPNAGGWSFARAPARRAAPKRKDAG